LYVSENIHISATFASLSTNDASACLIYATSLLDAQMDWIGTKGASTQALDFPRDNLVDKNGYDVTSTDIPIPIQRATSYFGYFLSQENRISDPSNFGFKSLKAGSLEMVVDKYDRRPVMPNFIFDLLKPFGTKINSAIRTLVRK